MNGQQRSAVGIPLPAKRAGESSTIVRFGRRPQRAACVNPRHIATADAALFFRRPPALAPRSSSGFALVELVAVLVLVAVAISIVTLSFSRNFAGAKTQAASRDLVAALRYTRGQAIVKGKEATFDLDLASNRYQAPGKASVQLPKNMRLNMVTAEQEQTSETSGRIRFFPDGASTGGHVSILMDRVEWKISVDWLTGAVTREELKDQ